MRPNRLRTETGQLVITAALAMPFLIGFLGLAIDAGFMYDYRRQMQTAADSAAVSAALYRKTNGSGTTETQLATVARVDTDQNGFTHGTSGITVTACYTSAPSGNTPPACTGAGGSTAFNVKVTIDRPTPTFFMRVLGWTSMTVGVTASAGTSTSGLGSMYLLAPSGGKRLSMTAGSHLTVAGPIYVNSTDSGAIHTPGGSTIQASEINVVGGFNICGCTPTPTTGVPPVADPMAGVSEPSPVGPTYSMPVQYTSGSVTLTPGTYTKGITISGSGTNATFSPGLYTLDDDFTISGGATVTGSGVTIYQRARSLKISSSSTHVTFIAPTSGTYEGIVFFQARSNSSDATIQDGVVDLTGIFYQSHLSSKLKFSGDSTGAALYTIFVVNAYEQGSHSVTINNGFPTDSGFPLYQVSLSD